MAILTLIGMYNYDDTIFDNLTLPDGIDKTQFINTLLMEKGEFSLMYSDPNFLKNMINVWGLKWARTFAEWLRGTQASWNPVENYDRYEDLRSYRSGEHAEKTTANYNNDRTAGLTEKRTADLTDKRTANIEDARTANLEDKRTADLTDKRTLNVDDKTTFNSTLTDTQTVDGTSTHDVSAFDSSSYSHESKDITNAGTSTHAHTGDDTVSHDGTDTLDTTGTDTMSHTGTDTVKTTGTDTMDHTGTDTMSTTGTDKYNISGTLADKTGTDSDKTRAVNHVHGNIGVTQASDMLKAFYDISTWNLYKNMSDIFAREFLICIY